MQTDQAARLRAVPSGSALFALADIFNHLKNNCNTFISGVFPSLGESKTDSQ